MKRLIAAALTICLLLGGCGVIKENNVPGQPVPVSVLDMSSNEYLGRVERNSAIYFLNEASDADTLTADPRTLVIGQDTNPAAVAVEKLLEGPSNDNLISVAPAGIQLDYIEYSREIANVYLLYDGEDMPQKNRYTFERALTNTVSDSLGAAYISVFYNGIQLGYDNVPCAPYQKETGSIGEAWQYAEFRNGVPVIEPEPDPQTTADTEERDETIEPEPIVSYIDTVLYFISADGGFILPEVHEQVKYTDGNYISMLIEELKRGPQNTSIMTSPLVDDLKLEGDPELTDNGDGTYTLALHFSELPTQYEDANAKDELLSYAALVYTITGFIPGIRSIDLYVKDTLVTTVNGAEDGLQRSDYTGYIGSSAPLYFTDTDSDLLLEVARSMEQGQIWSAKARVLEIMSGPQTGDEENVFPAMPNGTTTADVLSVDVYNDTAYVNLSQNFKDACTAFSAKSEMLLVYAIVNTLTAMDGITKVQFLVEGEQIDTFAGHLCLTDPFLRNYGIIKKTG